MMNMKKCFKVGLASTQTTSCGVQGLQLWVRREELKEVRQEELKECIFDSPTREHSNGSDPEREIFFRATATLTFSMMLEYDEQSAGCWLSKETLVERMLNRRENPDLLAQCSSEEELSGWIEQKNKELKAEKKDRPIFGGDFEKYLIRQVKMGSLMGNDDISHNRLSLAWPEEPLLIVFERREWSKEKQACMDQGPSTERGIRSQAPIWITFESMAEHLAKLRLTIHD